MLQAAGLFMLSRKAIFSASVKSFLCDIPHTNEKRKQENLTYNDQLPLHCLVHYLFVHLLNLISLNQLKLILLEQVHECRVVVRHVAWKF